MLRYIQSGETIAPMNRAAPSWKKLRSVYYGLDSTLLKCGRYLPRPLKRRLKNLRLFQRVRNSAANWQAPAPLCVLPWTHAHVATTGDVHLCCIATGSENSLGNVHGRSIGEIFASGPVAAIRRQMLGGEWPRQCGGCRKREALGLLSYRQGSNSKNSRYVQLLTSNPEALTPAIRSIDLRPNNICNFKCRSCGSEASNSWFSDHNLINPQHKISQSYQGFEKEPAFWSELDEKIIPLLEELTLGGGEPLLSQSHYRLLERLIACGKQDTAIKVVTNLSHLRFMHWDAVELWKHFPNLTLTLSLDGVGAQGEYIRRGMNYPEWVENAKRLKRELPDALYGLHFVVSIFNVTDLRKHYETIVQGEFVDPDTITFTFLTWPAYMSIQVLSPELKIAVENDLRAWLSESRQIPGQIRAQFEALIEFMKEADGHKLYSYEFASKTKLLDQARGEDAVALFPKLKSMLVV